MKQLTRILLLAVAFLLLLGVVASLSATTCSPALDRFGSHLVWVGLGSIGCAVAARVDYTWLRKWYLPRWSVVLGGLLLVAVLIPGVGVVRNGASRWLLFGQPSELAKLALVLFLADHGARYQTRMHERCIGFLYPGTVAGAVILLVFLEPDWGTASLMAAVCLALLMVAGTHWGYLLSAAIIGAELFAWQLLQNPLRLERLMAYLDPEKYRGGVGWQGWHAVLALGNGGPFGTFFGEGSHKNGFVPEQATDFVLSLIGEETGFVGTALVVLLFLVILFCGARIAWSVSDPFGQLLATGLTVLIALQAFINIGVVTSSLPNKGIALPFVSYGGSNLVCLLLGVGWLLSIARYGPGPVGQRMPATAQVKARGPVGSLLLTSLGQPPGGLRGIWSSWPRARRNAPFPRTPMHLYQRPPRLFN